MISNKSFAAEYYIDPSASMRLQFDDNIRLTTQSHSTVGGSILEGKADIGYRTQRTSLQFTPTIQSSRHTQDVGLDNDNVILDFSGLHTISPKLQLNLSASLRDESIGVREVNVIGNSFVNASKENISINPSMSYAINERMVLQVSNSLSDITYENGQSFGLNSSESQQTVVSYNYVLNEKNSINAVAYRTNFEVTDTGTEITNNAFQLGFSHSFNESLSVSANAGMIFSNSEFNVNSVSGVRRDEADATGNLFNVEINKSFETINASLRYEKDVSPGIRGDQDLRDSWIINLQKKFSDRLFSRIYFNYYDNESQNEFSVSNNSFNSLTLRSSVHYSLSNYSQIELGYAYRSIENENSTLIPSSNSVYLNISYDFDKISISR